jgi:hypothetical protein
MCWGVVGMSSRVRERRNSMDHDALRGMVVYV